MSYSGKYTRSLSRHYPGLFVILLDQSGSMSEAVEDSNYKRVMAYSNPKAATDQYTKAEIATAAINLIIDEMIQAAGVDQYTKTRKNYAYLSVIGYNDSIYPLISRTPGSFDPIDIPTLAQKSVGEIQRRRYIQGPLGASVEIKKKPYWLTPDARGNTQMAKAFEQAKIVAQNWLAAPPEYISPQLEYQRPRKSCFPPVIINITDAMNNGDDDPVAVTNEIRLPRNGTEDGEILIFNCHFTKEKGRATIFPGNVTEVNHLDPYGFAEMMFTMSSEIPDVLRPNAQTLTRNRISPSARCYVFNADTDVLVKFLQWGTIGSRVNPGSVGVG